MQRLVVWTHDGFPSGLKSITTYFYYFADHREELSRQVKAGRAEFLAQFRSLANPVMQRVLPDPADPDTFVRSKLDPAERYRNGQELELHRSLIRLRRHDPVFSRPRHDLTDGAVLGPEAFLLSLAGRNGERRLLLFNFGTDLHLEPAPEPLLAPPRGANWSLLWSSENPDYGGRGTAVLDDRGSWWLPGHAAVVLMSVPQKGGREGP